MSGKNWYQRGKESAAYYYEEDEEGYMKYYDVSDGAEISDSKTYFPVQEEDEDLSMTKEFGDPEAIRQNILRSVSNGDKIYKDNLKRLLQHPDIKNSSQSKRSHMHPRGVKMSRRRVVAYIDRLDSLANDLEYNHAEYGLSKRAGEKLAFEIDKIAEDMEDKKEEATEEAMEEVEEEDKESIVMEQDPDEPYNGYYDIGGTMMDSQDPDEPYMNWYDEEKGNEFDNPYGGETGEELMGHERRESSRSNWYDREKSSSSQSGSNWYEDRKTSKTSSTGSDASNWYDKRKQSSRSESGEESSNWYDG
jgi:hypothetical protein